MLLQSLIIGASVMSLSVFLDLGLYAWRRLNGYAPCRSADIAGWLVFGAEFGAVAACGSLLASLFQLPILQA